MRRKEKKGDKRKKKGENEGEGWEEEEEDRGHPTVHSFVSSSPSVLFSHHPSFLSSFLLLPSSSTPFHLLSININGAYVIALVEVEELIGEGGLEWKLSDLRRAEANDANEGTMDESRLRVDQQQSD